MFKLYKRLIQSVNHYSFSENERKAIRDSSMDYLKKNLSAPVPMIQLMIHIVLLRKLIDNHLLPLSKAQEKDFDSIGRDEEAMKSRARERTAKWEGRAEKDQLQKLSAADKREWAMAILAELKDTDVIQKKLVTLASNP